MPAAAALAEVDGMMEPVDPDLTIAVAWLPNPSRVKPGSLSMLRHAVHPCDSAWSTVTIATHAE